MCGFVLYVSVTDVCACFAFSGQGNKTKDSLTGQKLNK
jgi:hypothetical protein